MRWLAALLLAALVASPALAQPDDPYLWLEDVQGERALDWVRDRNARTRAELEADPRFEPLRGQLLEILDARDRIPGVERRGRWLYNFWRDERHVRGIWRRTTLAEYRKTAPRWETVLDLDALAAAEHEPWVWGGASCHGPRYRRCAVALSRGGADARVMREFDTVAKRFVDGGFVLPQARSSLTWLDADTVYVATDFGPGSLTASGYPRVVKRWRRGQPLAEARTVFEGAAVDVSVGVTVDRSGPRPRIVFARHLDFYRSQQFLLHEGRLQAIDKPPDAWATFWRGHLLIELRSDLAHGGATFPAGSLLATDAASATRSQRRLAPLFTPSATRSLAGFAPTRRHLLLNVLDDVVGRLEERHFAAGLWHARSVDAPGPGTLHVRTLHDPQLADDPLGDAYLLTYVDFLTPETLHLARAGSDRRETLKARPAAFDAAGLRAEQRFATSRDGTRVPYFLVWPRGAAADGNVPTLLYGYGGFELAWRPWYPAAYGRAWLGRGGAFAVANIRGGGEYGPAWHQAALKGRRQRSFDDFIAVAEDLIAHGVTRPQRLAIEGGSNGGLLVAAVMLQRPELFGAVISQVPLLDMRRYHKLLAGASWIAEYGDPDDPSEWPAIARYSPYQNVRPGVRLPPVLFTTSTRDDRVHPGHARKMTARMLEQGHEVLYYENIEGGHGLAADNRQRAYMSAVEFVFAWRHVGR